MRNRKAELTLVQMINIVIGILIILLLIFLGMKAWGLLSFDSAKEQAEASLNNIISKINYLKENPNLDEEKVEIFNPKGWYIRKSQTGMLCICPDVSMKGDLNNWDEICKSKGVCKEVGNVELFQYQLGNTFSYEFHHNFFYFANIPYIGISNIPFKLVFFNKDDSTIGIYSAEGPSSSFGSLYPRILEPSELLDYGGVGETIKDKLTKLIGISSQYFKELTSATPPYVQYHLPSSTSEINSYKIDIENKIQTFVKENSYGGAGIIEILDPKKQQIKYFDLTISKWGLPPGFSYHYGTCDTTRENIPFYKTIQLPNGYFARAYICLK